MVRAEISEFLDNCVKKSLEHYREGLTDYTMVAVAQDTSLHPDFDPFDMLAYELMSFKYRDMLGIDDAE
tara:strand:+ start:1398 stop:1604 length:207 start_codon:yes stop_codon:yes gene_type:complete